MPNKDTEYSSPFAVNNQLYFCGVPFRLDTYNGCTHRCVYCLAGETLVTMSDLSVKQIANVKQGDKVIGFDEFPVNNQRHIREATVLATSVRRVEEIWRTVTPTGDLYSTGNHQWMHARGGWTEPRYFSIQGTSLRKLFTPINYTETPDYQHGYIVGFADAEGSLRYVEGQKRPAFGLGQAEHNIEAFNRFMLYMKNKGFENLTITKRQYKRYDARRIEDGTMRNFFGMQMQDLSRVKRMYELMQARPDTNIEFRRGWLSGFFDGEGTCSKPCMGGSISISNRSNTLLNILKDYGKTFNFEFSANSTSSYLVGGTREAMRFLSVTNPAISRKKNAWIGNTRWGITTRIEETEPIRKHTDVYDLETDTHTFIAGGYASHNCFVRAAELTSASRKNRGQTIMVADENSVKRELTIALDQGLKRESINIEWLRHRVPIHWGGMSDPFQHCERKYQISKKWMEYLSWYEYPVVISTKGIMMAEPEYLEILKEGNYAVQVTLLTDNEEFVKAIEPGAPSVAERMKALEILSNAGIWTAVRIQPVIPNSIIEQDMPNFIGRLAKIGVKHIMCEGYKVPVRAEKEMKQIWELCPEAVKEYRYNDVKSEGFELLLPTWRKWQYTNVAIQACHENGMTYGAADNDLRDMGDVVCCCGIDNLPGFENFWRYQASQAAKIAKEKGFVELEDMQQFWHGEKGFSLHNDLIRLTHKAETGRSTSTPKYAVDFMWERGGGMSPECMYSMKRATRDGKLVYERTDPVPSFEANRVEQKSMF